MVFSFARVGAVVGMNVEDYFPKGKRFWFRLHEKGGKYHEVPAHHKAEAYVDTYIEAAGIGDRSKSPLFCTLDRHRRLTGRRMNRVDVFQMIRRRARRPDYRRTSAATPFAPRASPPIWTTAAPLKTPNALPPTSRPGRPSSMTARGMRSHWMRLSGFLSEEILGTHGGLSDCSGFVASYATTSEGTVFLSNGWKDNRCKSPASTTEGGPVREGKFQLNVFSALAIFERNLMRERTLVGLHAARPRTDERS